MQFQTSRRSLLRKVLAASAVAPGFALFCRDSVAVDAAALDPQDPGAKAFAFVADASQVDASAHPTFRNGQRCSVCAQYQGKASDTTAGCSIFNGRVVPAGGWCKVWSQRSA